MTKTTILFLALAILISCKKDSDKQIENILTLNSSVNNHKFYGFSFSAGRVILSDSNPMPDFSVAEQRNDAGEPIGIFLFKLSPDFEKSFYLKKTFGNLDSAKSYFNSCLLDRDTVFQQLALPIRPFQIWIIRTNEHKFGKILIHEATRKSLNSSSFAEVKFQWLRFN